ncbi:30S ribosomal protein S9 [Candidatus Nomurabacteria bacterium]|uniref:Small ribosomal subunit protein uS9 n=1 Tax=candidate division WWE3 bacterium TaxID=2053526 RepID=A0A955IW28_UNCKA|nr:30S ribosomal protein S9 [candidate division WWE3 bacterium]MCB9823753.1 30S ribosomal protein S9 [Candidatus Nomurabacteria bacterium]MCB9826841.1 30S ribosomal protein S9 [Candidatus Nomurabacteria bacterium]MCB9827548.1 30S ribosomal protein S9 [Candidatus Nomurabacteria bacterium]
MKPRKDFISGTGRRKTSVASVFLYKEKGQILINGMPIAEYFPSEKETLAWTKPFHAIGVSHPEAQFSATIKVSGSGKSAQLGAVVLGISRALAKIDEEFELNLKKLDLLTRDSRMVERKKPYLRKARKRPQFSKR